MPINILIVDSHIILSRGLKLIIEENPEFRVTGIASTLNELVEHLYNHKPDVIFINKCFSIADLYQAFSQLNKLKDAIKTICITNDTSENSIREFLKMGVKAVLSKKNTVENLHEAILAVASGKLYVEIPKSGIGTKIIEHVHTAHFEENNVKYLSGREYEVIKLFAQGLTYKGIAKVLNISPRTVESHKNHILSKLNLKTVTDMVKYAIRHNLIEL